MRDTTRKIFALLSKQERRQVYWLFLAVLGMAFMQVVGIASIIPFLALVADPDRFLRNDILNWLYTTLNFSSTNSFLIFVGFVVLGILTLSNAITALTTWRLDHFSWMQEHRVSKRLLTNYLYRPYAFFLNQNTSILGKNILSEVHHVIKGILVPGMQLVARAIVTFFILILLVIVNPVLAVSVATITGGAYAGIYVALRRKLIRTGKERVKSNRARFKAASEALSGVKDVKVLGREQTFIKEYSTPSRHFAHHLATEHAIGSLPKYAVESIAFGGILLIVLYLLAVRQDMSQVLPIIGLYAVAGYRLMPAMQQIYSSMTRIRFHMAALDVLDQDLQYQTEERPQDVVDRQKLPALPFRDRLELRDVTFKYRGAKEPVFSGLNLTVEARTSVAFVGSTGSGKTTTVDIILGLLRPEQGYLAVDGVKISDENLASWQKTLGYVPQQIYLTDNSVARNIAFGVPKEHIDMAAVERAAKVAHIHDFVMTEMPAGYDTVVGERGVRLSGGQRQRIGIARALYHDPDVLILDEATSALDGVTEEGVFQAVEDIAKTKTVIMIAHRITTIRNCDVIYLLDRGHIIAQGSHQELLGSSPQFRAMAQLGSTNVELNRVAGNQVRV